MNVTEEPLMLHREYVALQAAGRPMRIQELLPGEIPDNDNAAVVYRAAFRVLTEEPLVRAIDGERLLLGESTFNPKTARQCLNRFSQLLGGRDVASELIVQLFTFPPLLAWNHAAYLRAMRDRAEEAMIPYGMTKDCLMVEDPCLSLTSRIFLSALGDSTGLLLADSKRMLVPALDHTRRQMTALIAEAKVMRAGLHVIGGKRAHGCYPPSLSLEAMEDPFARKPLVYRASVGGFTVYSVGENLVDDGGIKSSTGQADDIVWRHTDEKPGR